MGRLVEDELMGSLQSKQNCESTIERLNNQVELNNDQRQKLQAWRRNKEQRLDALEAEVKKYGRLGSINVDRLLVELNKRDSTLRALERGSASSEDRILAESLKFIKERNQVGKTIREMGQNMEKAEAKAELMRSELERGGMEPDSLVMLWHERWCETTKRVADVEAENAELKLRQKGKRGALQGISSLSPTTKASRSPRGSAPAPSTDFEEYAAFAVGLSVAERPPLQRRQIDRASTIMQVSLKTPNQKASPGKLKREDILEVNQSIRELSQSSSPKRSATQRGDKVANLLSQPAQPSRSKSSGAQPGGSNPQLAGTSSRDHTEVRPTYGLSGHGGHFVPQLLPKEVAPSSLRPSPKRSGTARRSVG